MNPIGLRELYVLWRIRSEMKHGQAQNLKRIACRYGVPYSAMWRHAQKLVDAGALACVRGPGIPNTYVIPEMKASAEANGFHFNERVGIQCDDQFIGFVAGVADAQHALVVIRNAGLTFKSRGVKAIPMDQLVRIE